MDLWISQDNYILMYLSIIIVCHLQISHFYFLWLFRRPKSCHSVAFTSLDLDGCISVSPHLMHSKEKKAKDYPIRDPMLLKPRKSLEPL